MKKIFAFVLASLMVLSLVPASAFAAITKDCPDTHNLNNCEYTLVETVIATCSKPGYTVYECDKCGEQFLADFVKSPKHTWVSNANKSDRKDVTATCKNKDGNPVDGVKYQICSVCKTTRVVETPAGAAHKLVYVSGYGCEALYECSVCEEFFYGVDDDGIAKETASHNWKFTEVIKEPEIVNGVGVPGAALYTCKDCKDTKEVDIFAPDCRCYGNEDVYTTLVKAYKAETCDEDGNHAIYKCNDCNQLFKYNKDSKVYTAIEKESEAVIDEIEWHTPDENGTTPGKFLCEEIFTCDECGEVVSYFAHDKVDGEYPAHMVVTEYSKVDCTNYGYKVLLCNFCGWNEAIFESPEGHKTETVVVPSTCGTYGYIYTYCTNEHCTIAETAIYVDTNNGGMTYPVAVDGKPVKVVSLVRNVSLDNNAHDVELVAKQEVTCVQPGLEVYKCKFCNLMTYETIPALGHNYDETKETKYQAPDCVNAGYIAKYCKNCKTWVETPISSTPGVHNYVLTNAYHHCVESTIPSTQINGTTKYYGREIYACSGCGIQLAPIMIDKVGTTSITTWFNSYEEAEFYHFGNKQLVNGEWVYGHETNDGLKNLTKVEGKGKASTCYSNGFEVYTCGKCNKEVYVTLPKAAHTKYKTVEAKAATCTATGNIEYNVCYECNTIFVIEDGEQVTKTVAEITVNKHASTLEKKTVKDCTEEVLYTYWQCTGEDCGKKFTDETASTAYTGTTKKVKHKWNAVVPYVAATCNSTGVVGIDYCAACGKFRITENYIVLTLDADTWMPDYSKTKLEKRVSDALTEAEAEAYELKCYNNINTPTIEIYVSANNTITANTIVIPKAEHGYHAETGIYYAITSETVTRKDCSKPAYTHNFCVLCDYEYLSNYLPASSTSGHANKYGQALTGDCGELQGIKDRECFYCGEVVEIGHEWADTIEVGMTCMEDGYTYQYCGECGWKEVVKVTFKDAKKYHKKDSSKVKVGVPADYANKGDWYWACKTCGIQLADTVKSDAKKTGIEIILSSDAENYALGSTIYVTVSLDSYYGAKVWGLDFNVNYDPAVVEFLDEETVWVTTTFTEAHDAAQQTKKTVTKDEDGKDVVTRVPTGVVKVAANARENVTVKGNQDLVVLAFKVIAPSAYGTNFLVPVYTEGQDRWGNPALLPAISVVNEKGASVNAIYNDFVLNPYPDSDAYPEEPVEDDFITEEAPVRSDFVYYADYLAAVEEYEEYLDECHIDYLEAVNEWYAECAAIDAAHLASEVDAGLRVGELLTVEFYALLDVDHDYKGGNDVTMSDILALYELIVFAEYDVAADTDFNGVIDMIDLANAYHVLVGRTTVEALAGVIPSDWIPAEGAKN